MNPLLIDQNPSFLLLKSPKTSPTCAAQLHLVSPQLPVRLHLNLQ
jgi:hypothetical protein